MKPGVGPVSFFVPSASAVTRCLRFLPKGHDISHCSDLLLGVSLKTCYNH